MICHTVRMEWLKVGQGGMGTCMMGDTPTRLMGTCM